MGRQYNFALKPGKAAILKWPFYLFVCQFCFEVRSLV